MTPCLNKCNTFGSTCLFNDAFNTEVKNVSEFFRVFFLSLGADISYSQIVIIPRKIINPSKFLDTKVVINNNNITTVGIK